MTPDPSHKQRSPTELEHSRTLRRKRVQAAKKAKVAIGFVDQNAQVMPGAPHLDPPKDAA